MSTHGRPVYLVGDGATLAPFRYTNLDLAPYFNVDEETALRYAAATGIESRCSVVDLADGRRQKVLNEDLATAGAQEALAAAGVEPGEVDMVVTASSKFDYLLPTIGSRLLKRLGIQEAMTFDLYGGCAQFMCGVHMATQYIRSGAAQTVLVTSSETLTSFSRMYRYPVDAFVFGDSGSAWVLTSLPRDTGTQPVFEIHETATGTLSEVDGEETEIIIAPITGLKEEFDPFVYDETIDPRMVGLHPDTRYEYRWIHNTKLARKCAVYGLLEGFERVTKDADRSAGGLIVPHQGTKPVLVETAEAVPDGWEVVENLADRGNLSTGCIPVAMYDHRERVREAETIVAASVGVGFTFAAARLAPA